MSPALPSQIRVVVRDWLNCNQIVLLGREAIVVDSGYVRDARRTLDASAYAGLAGFVEAERSRKASGRASVVTVAGALNGVPSPALALAKLAAQAGRRVLLVDARPPAGGVAVALGVGGGPGLHEWVHGQVPLERLVHAPNGQSVHVLAPGEAVWGLGDPNTTFSAWYGGKKGYLRSRSGGDRSPMSASSRRTRSCRRACRSAAASGG